MTVPVSTAPAVQEYLLNAFIGQANNDPAYTQGAMLVRLGAPGRDLPNDAIIIKGVNRNLAVRTFIGSGGQFWENESYDVTVEVSSWIGTGDSDNTSAVAVQLTERVWTLVGYVESAVRDDPSLGELVNLAYPSRSTQTGPEWTTDPVGLIAYVSCNIHCECLN